MTVNFKSIKRQRQQLKLSQREVASEVGESGATLALLEAGKIKASPARLRKYRDAIDRLKQSSANPATIRPRRIKLRVSVSALARRANIDVNTLSCIERLKQRPWPATMAAIVAALEEIERCHPGKMLRAERRARGLTQAALAKLADVAPDVVYLFEEGKRLPTPKNLTKIEAAIACTPEVILAAEEVKARRRALGLSQVEFAGKAKVSVTALAHFEADKHGALPGTVARIGAALAKLERPAPTLSFTSGEELRKAREAAGAPMEKFAARAGVSYATLWLYETDRRTPRMKVLLAFDRVLREAQSGKPRPSRPGPSIYSIKRRAKSPRLDAAATGAESNGTAEAARSPATPKRRGPMPSNATATIYRECYALMVKGDSLKSIVRTLRDRYVGRSEFSPPRTAQDVSSYARRHAVAEGKIWPIPRPSGN